MSEILELTIRKTSTEIVNPAEVGLKGGCVVVILGTKVIMSINIKGIAGDDFFGHNSENWLKIVDDNGNTIVEGALSTETPLTGRYQFAKGAVRMSMFINNPKNEMIEAANWLACPTTVTPVQ